MARKITYSNERIIAALKQTKGLVYLAAKSIGCDPDTIYKRAKKCVAVADAIRTSRGEIVDTAELALYKAILDGQAWAIALTLKTLGKDRGYVERSEREHGGKVGVELEIVEVLVDGNAAAEAQGGASAPGATELPPK